MDLSASAFWGYRYAPTLRTLLTMYVFILFPPVFLVPQSPENVILTSGSQETLKEPGNFCSSIWTCLLQQEFKQEIQPSVPAVPR